MTNQPTGVTSYPPPRLPDAPHQEIARAIMANMYQPGQSDEPLMVLHDQLYDDDLSSDEKLARLRQAVAEGVLDEMVFWSWVDEFKPRRKEAFSYRFRNPEMPYRDIGVAMGYTSANPAAGPRSRVADALVDIRRKLWFHAIHSRRQPAAAQSPVEVWATIERVRQDLALRLHSLHWLTVEEQSVTGSVSIRARFEFNGHRCRDGVIQFTMSEMLDRDTLFGELLPARLRKLVQNATRLYMDGVLTFVGLEGANDHPN